MRDDRFEWDDRKAASNARKHRVSFDNARAAFDDPHAILEPDDDPDEDRWKCIGMTAANLFEQGVPRPYAQTQPLRRQNDIDDNAQQADAA